MTRYGDGDGLLGGNCRVVGGGGLGGVAGGRHGGAGDGGSRGVGGGRFNISPQPKYVYSALRW